MRNCVFCGFKHEFQKEKCPAWGKHVTFAMGETISNQNAKRYTVWTRTKILTPRMSFWLAYVEAESNSKITASVKVNDCDVKFQIDTGAEINTICQKHVKKTQGKNKTTVLRMWNKSTWNSLGEATLKVTNPLNNEENDVNFVAVRNGSECLLGLKTINKLNLITINSEKFI